MEAKPHIRIQIDHQHQQEHLDKYSTFQVNDDGAVSELMILLCRLEGEGFIRCLALNQPVMVEDTQA